ncbi:MAG: alpha/beta hydrolase [Kangiellaceae bacterium]|nr:alpha/beta hydrolase [Kangiellaceae bacterium]MCW9000713.1 alpha/beta hydrolase [Kangiellaceae bacterium]
MIEYRLNLAGCECAVAEWNPDAKILVFGLHGWLDNLATFEGLAAQLENIRLVAIDFPGHGHSRHIPLGASYHFYDGMYLISDLAEHFKQDKINLLGHSMGGAISTVYSASLPDRVKALALIESIGPLTAEPQEISELFSRAVIQREALRDKRKPIYPSFEQALKARAEASNIQPDLIKSLVERALTRVEEGYTWRADSRLRTSSPLRLSEPHLQHIMGDIKSPILLIEGHKGFLKQAEHFKQRKQIVSKIEIQEIPGGHHVHLEQTQACANKISEFFNKYG